MKRYKRGIVVFPSQYGRSRAEMNLYKNETGDVFISWEGGWQKLICRPQYGEWEFY